MQLHGLRSKRYWELRSRLCGSCRARASLCAERHPAACTRDGGAGAGASGRVRAGDADGRRGRARAGDTDGRRSQARAGGARLNVLSSPCRVPPYYPHRSVVRFREKPGPLRLRRQLHQALVGQPLSSSCNSDDRARMRNASPDCLMSEMNMSTFSAVTDGIVITCANPPCAASWNRHRMVLGTRR